MNGICQNGRITVRRVCWNRVRVIVRVANRPTVNVIIGTNAKDQQVPGVSIKQAENRRAATFTVQIRKGNGKMQGMQNQDPGNQCAHSVPSKAKFIRGQRKAAREIGNQQIPVARDVCTDGD